MCEGVAMQEPITIRCRENGPLVLPRGVRIVDSRGVEYAIPDGKELIALCRCGASATKPFCDGSHKRCGFDGGPPASPADDR
jgi:CDGSH-type Zn-finger protein